MAPADTARLTAVYAPLTSPNMALREIIILPDKRLRLKSEPIKRIDAGDPQTGQ